MTQNWIFKPEPDEETVDKISTSLGFGTFESKLLVMRGIDDYQKAREFFKPKIEDMHNPFLMAALYAWLLYFAWFVLDTAADKCHNLNTWLSEVVIAFCRLSVPYPNALQLPFVF